jgi:hypothetical protein
MRCGCSCASSPTISAISSPAGSAARHPELVPDEPPAAVILKDYELARGRTAWWSPPQPPRAVKWPSRRPEGRASPAPTNSGAGVASTLFAHAQRGSPGDAKGNEHEWERWPTTTVAGSRARGSISSCDGGRPWSDAPPASENSRMKRKDSATSAAVVSARNRRER